MKNIVLGVIAAILVLYITPQNTRQNIPLIDTAVGEVEDRVEGVLDTAVNSVRDSLRSFLQRIAQDAINDVLGEPSSAEPN